MKLLEGQMYQEDGDPAAALVTRIGQEPKSALFGGLRRQLQPNPTEGGAQTNLANVKLFGWIGPEVSRVLSGRLAFLPKKQLQEECHVSGCDVFRSVEALQSFLNPTAAAAPASSPATQPVVCTPAAVTSGRATLRPVVGRSFVSAAAASSVQRASGDNLTQWQSFVKDPTDLKFLLFPLPRQGGVVRGSELQQMWTLLEDGSTKSFWGGVKTAPGDPKGVITKFLLVGQAVSRVHRSQAVSELKRMVQECREWNVTEVRDVTALRALLEGQSERTVSDKLSQSFSQLINSSADAIQLHKKIMEYKKPDDLLATTSAATWKDIEHSIGLSRQGLVERFKKVGEMAKLLRAVQLELQDRAKSKRFTRPDLQSLEARLQAIRGKGTELQTLDDQLQAAWWRQCSELFGNMGHQALFALAETQKQTGEQIRARLQDINAFKEERERMAGELSALKKQAEVEEAFLAELTAAREEVTKKEYAEVLEGNVEVLSSEVMKAVVEEMRHKLEQLNPENIECRRARICKWRGEIAGREQALAAKTSEMATMESQYLAEMEKLKGKQERDGQELQEAMRKYGAHTVNECGQLLAYLLELPVLLYQVAIQQDGFRLNIEATLEQLTQTTHQLTSELEPERWEDLSLPKSQQCLLSESAAIDLKEYLQPSITHDSLLARMEAQTPISALLRRAFKRSRDQALHGAISRAGIRDQLMRRLTHFDFVVDSVMALTSAEEKSGVVVPIARF